MTINPALHRFHLLAGDNGMAQMDKVRVAVFGVGGVGSWCAEALVRSGIANLTLVDSDLICVTNINRQVQATHLTVGKSKVAELRTRLLTINPGATIVAQQAVFDRSTYDTFNLTVYDYVIDAIDSLSSKVELIIRATEAGAVLYSALGASCRLDPTRIKIDSIWKSDRCRLGRFVRKRLRRRGFNGDFLCVYSDETIPRFEGTIACGTGNGVCPKKQIDDDDMDDRDAHEWCGAKKQINGSAVHITGTCGFFLAGLVVQDVIARAGGTSEKK
jgi:tRNA A37 threonylcarbamoyladenosine dehydratase